MSDEPQDEARQEPKPPLSVWNDPEFAANAGRDLLEQLRALEEPEPSQELGASQKFGASLRAQVLKRSRRLLRARNLGEQLNLAWHAVLLTARRSWAFRLAFLGLFLSLGFLLGRELWWSFEEHRIISQGKELVERAREDGGMVLAEEALSEKPSSKPKVAPGKAADRQAWLRSENELRRLRELFDERATPEYQRRLLEIAGVDLRVQRRIGYLAGGVAAGLRKRLLRLPENDYDTVEELSLGLRALLASGSMLEDSPHREVSLAVLARLESLLVDLAKPERIASFTLALAGYLEGVLQSGDRGRLDALSRYVTALADMELGLQRRAERLARGERLQDGSRALPLTHWATPLAALVDAGVLLRFAPALGVLPDRCRQLRENMVAHLVLRGKRGPRMRASCQAAQLFAFSDLVDREGLKARLQGYRLYPDRLAGDVRSVRYLAWGAKPMGYGFARVNQALRHFVANHEPRTLVDRSALLLVQLFYVAPHFD
ncbi:MAG: hypothetical protein CSA62_14835 [Planctomycetota bacterium]|nr:MAG: hypothetical protein CSA62_14835 [Planctomycetota bacterium]